MLIWPFQHCESSGVFDIRGIASVEEPHPAHSKTCTYKLVSIVDLMNLVCIAAIFIVNKGGKFLNHPVSHP